MRQMLLTPSTRLARSVWWVDELEQLSSTCPRQRSPRRTTLPPLPAIPRFLHQLRVEQFSDKYETTQSPEDFDLDDEDWDWLHALVNSSAPLTSCSLRNPLRSTAAHIIDSESFQATSPSNFNDDTTQQTTVAGNHSPSCRVTSTLHELPAQRSHNLASPNEAHIQPHGHSPAAKKSSTEKSTSPDSMQGTSSSPAASKPTTTRHIRRKRRPRVARRGTLAATQGGPGSPNIKHQAPSPSTG